MTVTTTRCFVAGFFAHAERLPDRPAYVFADRTYSYGEVMRLVQGAWQALDDVPGGAGDRVGIVADQNVYTYAAILAVLASGRAYVPLLPHAPAERNWSCVEQAEVRTVLYGGGAQPFCEWIRGRGNLVTCVDLTRAAPEAPVRTPAAIPDEAMAYLLFTSGSTGTPKGVPIYHRNLRAFFAALLAEPAFDFRPTDRFLQMFDLTFDLSVMSAFAPLLVGACACIPAAKGVGYLSVLRTLQQQKVTVALMVPSVLSFLDRYFDEINLPDLRCSMFCGEALPADLVTRWAASVPNARLLNVYGPTEATIFCSLYEIPRDADPLAHHGTVCIGRPLDGSELIVLDAGGRPAREGEIGDLYLAGGQVTDRYWNNPDRTCEAFQQLGSGPDRRQVYRTGDLALVRGGQVFYCGRSDQQVKIAGYRVELGEIEHHARQATGTDDCVVLARRSPDGTCALHLVIKRADRPGAGELTEFRAELARRLPPYMVPQRIHALANMPLNQNGKIDRRELAALVDRAS